MNLITWYSIGIFSLLQIGSLSSSVWAQNFAEAGFENLTLTIVAAKPQFPSLEPLTLEIVVQNKTAYPIKGHAGLCLKCERLELFRGRVGEPRTKIPELTGLRALIFIDEKVIQPGEIIRERVLFEFDLHTNFPEPRPYRLHAVLYDLKKQTFVESKPITIVIIEPQGIDRLALKHLEDLYNGQAEKFWMRGSLEDNEEFMLLFNDATYAPYVADSLAAFYSSRNPDKAIEYLEFEAGRSHYPWADKALRDLFGLHQKLGQKAKSELIVERLKQNYPDSPYTRGFLDDEEYLEKLRSRLKNRETE